MVISYWSGLVDETDKCYLEGTPHGLMEAAGIRTEEIDALYDWEENVGIPETGNHLRLTESYTCKNLCELAEVSDAEVLLRYGRDFYQGYPVLTHKKYGKGHVYYVAADMEAAFYEDFLGRAAEEAGVKMPLTFIPEGISVTTREMRIRNICLSRTSEKRQKQFLSRGITKFSTDEQMKILLRLPPGF